MCGNVNGLHPAAAIKRAFLTGPTTNKTAAQSYLTTHIEWIRKEIMPSVACHELFTSVLLFQLGLFCSCSVLRFQNSTGTGTEQEQNRPS
uniref:Uncharacterized protein n=1 Tax=Globodera rostochiensis TaxID=31243 RepID=A0A914I1I9_GLORO